MTLLDKNIFLSYNIENWSRGLMSVTRPVNHLNTCSCAVCLKIKSPKSTKLLLTLFVDQHEYLKECAQERNESVSEVIRQAIDLFRNSNPLKKGKTLVEILSKEAEKV
jgi:hypothetical protein